MMLVGLPEVGFHGDAGVARHLSDSGYRRKISRQLTKGESLHALRRGLLYAHEGVVRARHLEGQTEQA